MFIIKRLKAIKIPKFLYQFNASESVTIILKHSREIQFYNENAVFVKSVILIYYKRLNQIKNS